AARTTAGTATGSATGTTISTATGTTISTATGSATGTTISATTGTAATTAPAATAAPRGSRDRDGDARRPRQVAATALVGDVERRQRRTAIAGRRGRCVGRRGRFVRDAGHAADLLGLGELLDLLALERGVHGRLPDRRGKTGAVDRGAVVVLQRSAVVGAHPDSGRQLRGVPDHPGVLVLAGVTELDRAGLGGRRARSERRVVQRVAIRVGRDRLKRGGHVVGDLRR